MVLSQMYHSVSFGEQILRHSISITSESSRLPLLSQSTPVPLSTSRSNTDLIPSVIV